MLYDSFSSWSYYLSSYILYRLKKLLNVTVSRESTEYQNNTESIWKANESTHNEHVKSEKIIEGVRKLLRDAEHIPVVSQMVANERMDIYVGEDRYHVVTADGEEKEIGVGKVEDPTVNIISDPETVELVSSGELRVEEAYKEDRIRIEGVGLINSIRVGFVNSLFGVYSFFSDFI